MKVVALLLAVMAAGLGWVAVRHLREQPPPPPPALHLSFPMPPGVVPGSVDEPLDAAISPSESQVIFVATRDGVQQLWRRSMDEGTAEPIPGTEGAQLPAWKQTGNVISFFAGGRLKQMTQTDGAIRDLAAAPAPAGATWLQDGSLLFAPQPRGPLQRLRDGQLSAATTLADSDTAHVFPVAISGSNDFVYLAERQDGRRMVRLVQNGAHRDLLPTTGHAVLVGNYVLHVRDGILISYYREPETGALAPTGVVLGLDAGVTPAGRSLFSASPRLLMFAPAIARRQELIWMDFAGARLGAIADTGDYSQVRLSPDERFAAVTVRDPLLRALDIAIVPASSAGHVRRITTALAADTDPVWSADGEHLLFRSMQAGTPALVTMRPAAPEEGVRVVLNARFDAVPSDWIGTQTEGRVLFHRRDTDSSNLWLLRLGTGQEQLEPLVLGAFNETDARWSPDGRWVAYVSDESGQPDIYARDATGTRARVSFGGGTRPRWTGDGRGLLFLRGAQVMRADVVENRFAPARMLFEDAGIRDYDVGRRSDRILAARTIGGQSGAPISVIANWSSRADGGRRTSAARRHIR